MQREHHIYEHVFGAALSSEYDEHQKTWLKFDAQIVLSVNTA